MKQSQECTTYDSKMCKNNYINDQLSLEIKDIDDLAVAWIVKKDGNTFEFSRLDENLAPNLEDTMWLWRQGGNHGNGKINITQWIHDQWEAISLETSPTLYLAIAIYDFPYEKWISAGKWSFDAKLTLNGVAKWHRHDFGHSDTKNATAGYGLKHLKLFKIEILPHEHSLSVSESIDTEAHNAIINTVKNKYNYTGIDKNTKKILSTKYPKKETETKQKNKWFIYLFDLFFLGGLFFLTYYFYDYAHSLRCFIIYNLVFLIYFFFRFKLGGKAWALVLRKKHDKELDSFMVILGLLFTASLGAITSFDFSAANMQSFLLYRIEVFTLYISTNLVFLYILSVISTYSVNSLKANRPFMLVLILLIGIGIFIQEIINFEQSYIESTTKVEICKIKNN